VIFCCVAFGNVDPDHGASSRIDEWSLGPFGICDYDGPETVRLRKYATGTHLILEEIGVETGVTSREVDWTKNKAKLFRYLRSDERPGDIVGRRRSVPVLLTYGFVLRTAICIVIVAALTGVIGGLGRPIAVLRKASDKEYEQRSDRVCSSYTRGE
jgi:hypothetical protein